MGCTFDPSIFPWNNFKNTPTIDSKKGERTTNCVRCKNLQQPPPLAYQRSQASLRVTVSPYTWRVCVRCAIVPSPASINIHAASFVWAMYRHRRVQIQCHGGYLADNRRPEKPPEPQWIRLPLHVSSFSPQNGGVELWMGPSSMPYAGGGSGRGQWSMVLGES